MDSKKRSLDLDSKENTEVDALWSKFCTEAYGTTRLMETATSIRNKVEKVSEKLHDKLVEKKKNSKLSEYTTRKLYGIYKDLAFNVSNYKSQLEQCAETLSLLIAIVEADKKDASSNNNLGYIKNTIDDEPNLKRKKKSEDSDYIPADLESKNSIFKNEDSNQTSKPTHNIIKPSSNNLGTSSSTSTSSVGLHFSKNQNKSTSLQNTSILNTVSIPQSNIASYRFGGGVEIPIASSEKHLIKSAQDRLYAIINTDRIEPNTNVIVKSEDNYILGIIKEIKNNNQYIIEDADLEEDGLRNKWTLNRKDFVVLPHRVTSTCEFPVGSKILALYPSTTCFYKAQIACKFSQNKNRPITVTAGGKIIGDPIYWLAFEDDEEGVKEVSSYYVLPVDCCEKLRDVKLLS